MKEQVTDITKEMDMLASKMDSMLETIDAQYTEIAALNRNVQMLQKENRTLAGALEIEAHHTVKGAEHGVLVALLLAVHRQHERVHAMLEHVSQGIEMYLCHVCDIKQKVDLQ